MSPVSKSSFLSIRTKCEMIINEFEGIHCLNPESRHHPLNSTQLATQVQGDPRETRQTETSRKARKSTSLAESPQDQLKAASANEIRLTLLHHRKGKPKQDSEQIGSFPSHSPSLWAPMNWTPWLPLGGNLLRDTWTKLQIYFVGKRKARRREHFPFSGNVHRISLGWRIRPFVSRAVHWMRKNWAWRLCGNWLKLYGFYREKMFF